MKACRNLLAHWGCGLPLIVAMAPLAISGCTPADPKEILDCEQSLQMKLKAPSTYKRIKAESIFMEDQKPTQVWVSIEYDAANAFGTPLRDTELCQYPATKGRGIDWDRLDEFRRGQLLKEADELEALTRTGTGPAPVPASKPRPQPNRQAKAAAPQRCWNDYCPCDTTDPDYGGADQPLCRSLKGGIPVTDQMFAAGAASRDARRQLREFQQGE